MKNEKIEVSIVMPCLNEQETLGICIEKAQKTLRELGICGEVVIADNGSTECSQSLSLCPCDIFRTFLLDISHGRSERDYYTFFYKHIVPNED